MMADIPEVDPTKDDTGAAGGASGGGDDDTQDWNLPGWPTEAPDERRRRWPGGARPKTKGPYTKLPQHEKDIPMTRFPKEQSGLPSTSKGTAETSFIERMPEGRVRDADSLKVELVHQRIQEQYPEYGKDGRVFNLKVVDGKVLFVRPRGGLTDPFLADGHTLNPKFLKLKAVQETLGPTREALVRQKEQEIQQKEQQRRAKAKSSPKLSKRTRRLQRMKMNNLLYVTRLAKELQKTPRGKPSLARSKTSLNRREISLRKSYPFGSGSKTSSRSTAGPFKLWFWLSALFSALLPLRV